MSYNYITSHSNYTNYKTGDYDVQTRSIVAAQFSDMEPDGTQIVLLKRAPQLFTLRRQDNAELTQLDVWKMRFMVAFEANELRRKTNVIMTDLQDMRIKDNKVQFMFNLDRMGLE